MHWEHTPFLFHDRAEAGRRLARELEGLRGSTAVVVGLARGGLVVAAEVARVLGLGLDAVAVAKVRHPLQPEYAIGAVTSDGDVFLPERPRAAWTLRERAVAAARAEAAKLDRELHGRLPPLPLDGVSCVLVDEGLATGASMIAATRWARGRGAARVLAAVPVAARASTAILRDEADEVVCPFELDDFVAVGLHYGVFGRLGERDIVGLLEESQPRSGDAAAAAV